MRTAIALVRDVIAEGNDVGLDFSYSVSVDASNVTARFNRIGINASEFVRAIVHSSVLVGNTEFGLKSSELAQVDARQNWWGSDAGPTIRQDFVTTPGEGDSVSLNVQFIPFKRQP